MKTRHEKVGKHFSICRWEIFLHCDDDIVMEHDVSDSELSLKDIGSVH